MARYHSQAPDRFNQFMQQLPALGQIYHQREQEQERRDFAKELSDPNTSLQRRKELSYLIDPKSAIQATNQNMVSDLMNEISLRRAAVRNPSLLAKNPTQPASPPEIPVGPSSQTPSGGFINNMMQDLGQTNVGGEQQYQPSENDLLSQERDLLLAGASKLGPFDKTAASQMMQEANQINQRIIGNEKNATNERIAATKKAQANDDKIFNIQTSTLDSIKSTDKVLSSLSDQLKVNESGKVGPTSRAALSKFLKKRGWSDMVVDAIQSPEGALFNTANKEIIASSLKQAFGAKPLGVEFEALYDMLAKEGRIKEANEIVIRSLMLPAQIENDLSKDTMAYIKNNPGISPIDLNTFRYEKRQELTDQYEKEWLVERDQILAMSGPKNYNPVPNQPAFTQVPPQGRRSLEEIANATIR